MNYALGNFRCLVDMVTVSTSVSNNSKLSGSINYTGQGFKQFYRYYLTIITVVCARNHCGTHFTNKNIGVQGG